MSEAVVPYIVGLWIVSGILGCVVGSQKDAPGAGVALGLIFGPLGLIAALSLDGRPMCPQCKGRLNGRASVCPYCHKSLAWIRGVYGDPTPTPSKQAKVLQEKIDEEKASRFTGAIESRKPSPIKQSLSTPPQPPPVIPQPPPQAGSNLTPPPRRTHP